MPDENRTRLSVRLNPNESALLKNIVKLTGLTKSQINRLALQSFLDAKAEGLPPEVKRLVAINKVQYRLREIKQLRWLGHLRHDARRWISLTEKIRKNEVIDLDRTERVIRDMREKDIERLIVLENEILEILDEL